MSESCVKDLKKAIIADQAEIKELRARAVRDADQAKNRALSLQDELDGLKHALHDLETKNRAELHDRDIRLAEQERATTEESRRREALELQAQNFKSIADAESKEGKEYKCRLEEELDAMKWAAAEAKCTASDASSHLNSVRATMARVAEEYGRLAAHSIPFATHRQMQLRCASLQLRNIRLERRLADRAVVVEQLTDYCRQASEEKMLITDLLREAEDDHRALSKSHTTHHDNTGYDDLQTAQTIAGLYQAAFQDVLALYPMAHQEFVEQRASAARLGEANSALQADVDALRLDYDTVAAELSGKSMQLSEAVSKEQALEERLTGYRSELMKLEEVLRTERESNGRLVRAAHLRKKNEEILRLEVGESVLAYPSPYFLS